MRHAVVKLPVGVRGSRGRRAAAPFRGLPPRSGRYVCLMRFALPIAVATDDIDALGHVNNVVYVRWMQEAATAHWESVTSAAERAAVTWVVTRHEVDYKTPAFAGERLHVVTWVGDVTGAVWERFIEVRRDADGRVLARGRSCYAALDPVTGRPRRIDAAIRAPFARAPSGTGS